MINQFIEALQTGDWQPTGEEIADLLWLAEQMGTPTYDQARPLHTRMPNERR